MNEIERARAELERRRAGGGPAQDPMARAMAEAQRRGLPVKRGIGAAIMDNLVGRDDGVQSYGETLGAMLNKAGEAMTFGLVGDEASAAVAGAIPGGMGYDQRLAYERQQEANMERDNPGLALGAEIGGGVLGALLPGGAIGTLGRGAGMGARVAASGAAGAGAGGVYGFMEGEGSQGRIEGAQSGATWGLAGGIAAPVVGAAGQKIADKVVGNRAIRMATASAPTTDELRAAGNAAYDAVDGAGVQIKPEAFDRTRATVLEALRGRTGFDELPGPGSLTPNSARVMQIMDEASGRMAQEPTAALPFRSLDQMRRQAGTAAGNIANKGDQKAGMTIIEGLDDFIQRLGPDDVVAGDVNALKDAIPNAREIWGRMSRSQLIDDAMAQEGNYLSGGASAIRNQFAKILRNDKLSRGFSEAEKAAMRRVVQGTMPEQIMNLLGGGIGQLAQIGAGFGVGGVPGALLGAGGAALARKGSEGITRKNAEIVRALVANGRLPDQLPVASEQTRRIIEALTRRAGAEAPQ